MLYLIRGLPGSGKTTYARSLGCLALEADQLCMKNGIYQYDHGRMARAHAWCLERAQEAICLGADVAVANTFAYCKFMQPYMEFAKKHDCAVTIVECVREYGNPHRIPCDAIAKMRATWEPIPEAWTKDARLIVIGGWNAADGRTWIGAGSSEQWFAVTLEDA